MSERLIAIANGPKCPKCGCDGFDDWWHDKSCRSGGSLIVEIYADLTCHGCGATFEVTRYHGGETHSMIPPADRNTRDSKAGLTFIQGSTRSCTQSSACPMLWEQRAPIEIIDASQSFTETGFRE